MIGVTSLSGLVIPTAMGAGLAAGATLVFAGAGLGGEAALAFAALAWTVDAVAVAGLGAWPVWTRLGHLGRRTTLQAG